MCAKTKYLNEDIIVLTSSTSVDRIYNYYHYSYKGNEFAIAYDSDDKTWTIYSLDSGKRLRTRDTLYEAKHCIKALVCLGGLCSIAYDRETYEIVKKTWGQSHKEFEYDGKHYDVAFKLHFHNPYYCIEIFEITRKETGESFTGEPSIFLATITNRNAWTI